MRKFMMAAAIVLAATSAHALGNPGNYQEVIVKRDVTPLEAQCSYKMTPIDSKTTKYVYGFLARVHEIYRMDQVTKEKVIPGTVQERTNTKWISNLASGEEMTTNGAPGDQPSLARGVVRGVCEAYRLSL
jgi:hypothetical protein